MEIVRVQDRQCLGADTGHKKQCRYGEQDAGAVHGSLLLMGYRDGRLSTLRHTLTRGEQYSPLIRACPRLDRGGVGGLGGWGEWIPPVGE